ncbi:hypothetical protein ACH5RR_001234 [Cinchona calisaya]|uniref:Retrovirus-related Pol polyprotein from transposon TNT 1-94 n=1 Tax=Cinchona calisaya TaxID=153742 RepID=A0ABD3B3G4_9GENT
MANNTVGNSRQMKAVISDVIPTTTKITEHKLNGRNYLDWSKTVRVYLRSIDKDDHLIDEPPSDDAAKKAWLREDARIFLQIRNSIDTEVIGLINHCEFIKDLMDYLAFLYSGKDNFNHIYDVCKEFYRPEKQERSLTEYFMNFKRVYEELNTLIPLSADVKTQQSHREQMAVMSFLAGLPSEFDATRTQILSSLEIVSLCDTFTRVLRVEGSRPSLPSITSALVSRGTLNEASRGKSNGSRNGHDFQGGGIASHGQHDQNQRVCYHCQKPGHTKRTCWLLHGKPRQHSQIASFTSQESNHESTKPSSMDKSVLVSADEFAHFTEYQTSLKSTIPSSLNELGKLTSCLVSSSSKWVIDSGATNHMTGATGILFSFSSDTNLPSVTLADGSMTSVVGSGIANPTTSISLSSVLCLPNFSFNLLSVSKITRTLNCFVSFFPDHCVFQDLMTKKIIGGGRESGGLYLLETPSMKVPKPIACLNTLTPLEIHYRLRHPLLSILKKLFSNFQNLSYLNCKTCQFAKHHCVSYLPRVNKRIASPFELVHYDVWSPCPVISESNFRYFVTFVDDYSRVTWLYLMKNISKLFNIFCSFCVEIKTQFNIFVHNLRSDNAKEYFSHPFDSYMSENGILHQSSCVDTPPQNGVAERKNTLTRSC